MNANVAHTDSSEFSMSPASRCSPLTSYQKAIGYDGIANTRFFSSSQRSLFRRHDSESFNHQFHFECRIEVFSRTNHSFRTYVNRLRSSGKTVSSALIRPVKVAAIVTTWTGVPSSNVEVRVLRHSILTTCEFERSDVVENAICFQRTIDDNCQSDDFLENSPSDSVGRFNGTLHMVQSSY